MGVVTGRAGDPGGNRVDPNLSTSHMLVMVMVTILGTKAIIAVTALMVMVMMGGMMVLLLKIGVLMMKCDDVTGDKGGVVVLRVE